MFRIQWGSEYELLRYWNGSNSLIIEWPINLTVDSRQISLGVRLML